MTNADKFATATIILSAPAKTWEERRAQIDEALALDTEDDAETAYRKACAEMTADDPADSTMFD